jgi:hypothetical protein
MTLRVEGSQAPLDSSRARHPRLHRRQAFHRSGRLTNLAFFPFLMIGFHHYKPTATLELFYEKVQGDHRL